MWMRAKKAGEYADVHESTIRRWFDEGLKSCKIGGCVSTKPEWIDEFIESNHSDKAVLDKVVSIVRGMGRSK